MLPKTFPITPDLLHNIFSCFCTNGAQQHLLPAMATIDARDGERNGQWRLKQPRAGLLKSKGSSTACRAHMHAKIPLQKVTDVYIPSVLAVAGLVYSVRQNSRLIIFVCFLIPFYHLQCHLQTNLHCTPRISLFSSS